MHYEKKLFNYENQHLPVFYWIVVFCCREHDHGENRFEAVPLYVGQLFLDDRNDPAGPHDQLDQNDPLDQYVHLDPGDPAVLDDHIALGRDLCY